MRLLRLRRRLVENVKFSAGCRLYPAESPTHWMRREWLFLARQFATGGVGWCFWSHRSARLGRPLLLGRMEGSAVQVSCPACTLRVSPEGGSRSAFGTRGRVRRPCCLVEGREVVALPDRECHGGRIGQRIMMCLSRRMLRRNWESIDREDPIAVAPSRLVRWSVRYSSRELIRRFSWAPGEDTGGCREPQICPAGN